MLKTKLSVVSFPNISGDTILVVPNEVSSSDNYTHLANFIRCGNKQQIDEFWRCVVGNYSSAIGTNPTWLSTAGLGVSWLHVRICNAPKYYRYEKYKL